ncbi:ribosome-associated translation inhibitor RaiA [soil metagenome]
MDIVVKTRHCEVSDRFRQLAADKLARLEKYDHKVIRVDVEVSAERNPRLADRSSRVELTLHSRGPTIRAEAAAEDKVAAFDGAMLKLQGQLRKAADRRRIHHGSRAPMSLAQATSTPEPDGATAAGHGASADGLLYHEGPLEVLGDGPLVVREKTHATTPMTLDQALYEMELVGHDFYLFVDKVSEQPSVVYRRRGYDYGVIRLAV